jgi:hypothetical protein
MFSVENFYYVLYTNLLEPLNINGKYFYPFGSTNFDDLYLIKIQAFLVMHNCVFHDQEPILNKVGDRLIIARQFISRKKINILAILVASVLIVKK